MQYSEQKLRKLPQQRYDRDKAFFKCSNNDAEIKTVKFMIVYKLKNHAPISNNMILFSRECKKF